MRIYVKMSEKMGEKLEQYASDFGVSKSAFVSFCVGQYIDNLEKQSDIYNHITDTITQMARPERQIDENQNEE